MQLRLAAPFAILTAVACSPPDSPSTPDGTATDDPSATAATASTGAADEASASVGESSGSTGTAGGPEGSASTNDSNPTTTTTTTGDDDATTGIDVDGSGSTGESGDTPPPDCAASTDCEACGAIDGCGWCGATGVCSAGDADGPAAGECTGGWEADGDFFSCPAANCFAQTNCGDCQDAYSGCGWCASNNTCMPGAPDVPAPGGECADQQWYFDICPEDCADEMTCVSCTGTVGCGWCFGSGSCAAGTDAGPLAGPCAGEWSTAVDACF